MLWGVCASFQLVIVNLGSWCFLLDGVGKAREGVLPSNWC